MRKPEPRYVARPASGMPPDWIILRSPGGQTHSDFTIGSTYPRRARSNGRGALGSWAGPGLSGNAELPTEPEDAITQFAPLVFAHQLVAVLLLMPRQTPLFGGWVRGGCARIRAGHRVTILREKRIGLAQPTSTGLFPGPVRTRARVREACYKPAQSREGSHTTTFALRARPRIAIARQTC
jgi:hypothetical protein